MQAGVFVCMLISRNLRFFYNIAVCVIFGYAD